MTLRISTCSRTKPVPSRRSTYLVQTKKCWPKLQAGGSGWDVFVPTNYTITTYVEEELIEPLDTPKLPNYDASAFDPRFADAGTVDGVLYAVPENWGTTGFAVNTAHTGGNETDLVFSLIAQWMISAGQWFMTIS